MHRTLEATIDGNGHVRLTEAIKLDAPRRALVTILEEPAVDPLTLVSEQVLSQDWDKPEEEAAWSHLQSDR